MQELLERQQLTAQIMDVIANKLESKGIMLKGGTVLDATLIQATTSTKNQKISTRPRDAFHSQKEAVVLWDEGPCGCV